LGVSLETAIKGLIACRGAHVPRKHDLTALLAGISDAELTSSLDASLQGLEVPEELFDANPDSSRSEIVGFYRRHRFHFEMINAVYASPYATRYPVLGGHVLPDALALSRLARVLQQRVDLELPAWRPKRVNPR
jgi:hypothetical protein